MNIDYLVSYLEKAPLKEKKKPIKVYTEDELYDIMIEKHN